MNLRHVCILETSVTLNLLLAVLRVSCSKLDAFAELLASSDSSLAVYAGTNDLVALTKLEKDDLEEAREVFWNTILTLAIADIHGGFVLPGLEKFVEYVQKKAPFIKYREQLATYSKIIADKARVKLLGEKGLAAEKKKVMLAMKKGIDAIEESGDSVARIIFRKARRWFGRAGKLAFKALGPVTDTVSIVLSAWSLKIGIDEGDSQKILSSSLALASGVVGLATFVLAIAVGSTILGPIGIFVGALLGISATLVELFGGDSEIDEFRDQIAQLNEIKEGSMFQLLHTIDYLKSTGKPFNDVYVVNQAALINFEGNTRFDVLLKEGSGRMKHSLVHRGPTNWQAIKWSPHPDVINTTFMEQGHRRATMSPVYYKEGSMQWVKSPFDYGYDFYGQHPNGDTYRGVRVLVNTNYLQDVETDKKGIHIDTTVPDKYEQNDIIRVSDYENIAEGKRVTIRTGPGHDAISIDGLVGRLSPEYQGCLDVDLGAGRNTLNLGGISSKETRFANVWFNQLTGELRYITHNRNYKFHSAGYVAGVFVYSGSPLDDVVILSPAPAFDESDVAGRSEESDTVADKDVTEPFRADFIVSQSGGSNRYFVNLTGVPSDMSQTSVISIIDHSPEQSYITIYDPNQIVSSRNLLYSNRTLHICSITGDKASGIIMSFLLRFSKVEPKIGIQHTTATDWIALALPDSFYSPLSKVNPVLVTGSRAPVNLQHRGEIIGTSRIDLVEVLCPDDQMGILWPRTVDLKDGIDYVLITLDFIDRCVESDEQTDEFVLHRASTTSNMWELKVGTSEFGLPNIILKNVEMVVNDYGHVLVDLRQIDASADIDLYSTFFSETKRQLGFQDESDDSDD